MPVRLAPLELATLDQLSVDAYALFVGSDERPLSGLGGLVDWRLGGALSRLLLAGDLVGGPSEVLLTTTNGQLPAARVFSFGLGPLAQVSTDRFSQIVRSALDSLRRAQVRSVAMGLPESPPAKLSARLVVDAVKANDAFDLVLVGDAQELALALPDVAARTKHA